MGKLYHQLCEYLDIYCLYIPEIWRVQPSPVHGDLVVGLRGKGDPVDVAGVVGGVDLTKHHHAALLSTVQKEGQVRF